MKKLIFALVLTMAFTGCTRLDSKSIAYQQLNSIKPCILDIVVYKNVPAGIQCATKAVEGPVSDELSAVLESYLTDLPDEIALPLIDLFNVGSVRDIAVIVMEYIRSDFEYSFTSIFSMAYAQGVPSLNSTPTLETDPYNWIQTAGLAFAMVTITAFIRANFLPKISGLSVPLLALAVGLIIKYAVPLIPSNIFNDIVQLIIIAMSGGGTVDIYRKGE